MMGRGRNSSRNSELGREYLGGGGVGHGPLQGGDSAIVWRENRR